MSTKSWQATALLTCACITSATFALTADNAELIDISNSYVGADANAIELPPSAPATFDPLMEYLREQAEKEAETQYEAEKTKQA